jgi:hypothetical protein
VVYTRWLVGQPRKSKPTRAHAPSPIADSPQIAATTLPKGGKGDASHYLLDLSPYVFSAGSFQLQMRR